MRDLLERWAMRSDCNLRVAITLVWLFGIGVITLVGGVFIAMVVTAP